MPKDINTGLEQVGQNNESTNQMEDSAPQYIDRYARGMIIENTIADATNFFHMDAVSAAVPLKSIKKLSDKSK